MNRPVMLLSVLFFILPIAYAQDHAGNFTGPFETPQDVTRTCYECHDNVAQEILVTRHWNWMGDEFSNEDGTLIRQGKINEINNFCIAVPSNNPRCTSCHIGYGWKDDTFDHSNPDNVDCLICHDQTGTYTKVPTAAGMPDPSVDLLKIAESVGKPTRANCGICHFDGGGGTGVKHGDMDDALYEPSRELDVHMGGQGFNCVDCHTTTEHKIAGASHGSMAEGTNHIGCTSCHEGEVHSSNNIEKHLRHVACETCHIPTYARGLPTKTWWDWSKAGQDIEAEKDEYGKELYAKKKGEFRWGKDLIPTYTWHNGSADYYHMGDSVGEERPLKLNSLKGTHDDPNSRLAPFKLMLGKQPYDPENGTLIVPKLFGADGYWKTFDWVQASSLGMKTVDLPFSGTVDFIETEMYWPLNHTVAPKEEALKCMACHGKNSRLDWEALGYTGDPMKTKESRLK